MPSALLDRFVASPRSPLSALLHAHTQNRLYTGMPHRCSDLPVTLCAAHTDAAQAPISSTTPLACLLAAACSGASPGEEPKGCSFLLLTADKGHLSLSLSLPNEGFLSFSFLSFPFPFLSFPSPPPKTTMRQRLRKLSALGCEMAAASEAATWADKLPRQVLLKHTLGQISKVSDRGSAHRHCSRLVFPAL